MGPRSRELLAAMSDADLSNAAFPFATAREIDLGLAFVRAARVTYVGELGWELYVPTEFAAHVYDEIVAAGEPFGLRHAGYHALDSLRIEKAYRHWGHDMTDAESPLEAGLGFTVAWDKPGGFIGREALVRQREQGIRRRLAVVVLDDPDAHVSQRADPARRPIVGWITSAAFGHTIGRSIGLGYVTAPTRSTRPGSTPAITRSRWPQRATRSRFRCARSTTPPRSAPAADRRPGHADGIPAAQVTPVPGPHRVITRSGRV